MRELLAVITDRTAAAKAARRIESVESVGDFLVVRFSDGAKPLYWPACFSLVRLRQVIGELTTANGWHYYEIQQTRIRPDDVVLDCGAAEGYFALLAADRCRRVYAIEPHPRFVDALNLTFRNIDNVEVMPVALSDSEGRAYLSDADIESSLSVEEPPSGFPIEVSTIDSLFRGQPVSYIKADLEGFEMLMLKGAANTIRRYKPRIAVTTYHKPEHAAEIAEFLRRVSGDYRILTKGIEENHGAPLMLHAWAE